MWGAKGVLILKRRINPPIVPKKQKRLSLLEFELVSGVCLPEIRFCTVKIRNADKNPPPPLYYTAYVPDCIIPKILLIRIWPTLLRSLMIVF